MCYQGRIIAALTGFLSVVVLGCLLTGEAAASWEAIGPTGGVRALCLNPHRAAEIFAVTASQLAQVYKSSDSAKSWRCVAGFSGPLYDIGVDAGNSLVVYALGASSLQKSEDGGLTWREIPLPSGFSGNEGRLILPSGRAGTVYAAGRKSQLAVAKSVDYGETWNLCCSGIAANSGYSLSAAVDPKNAERIYVGGYSNAAYRVYRTVDGGQSWTGTVLPAGAVPCDIVVDPFDPSKALLAAYNGVYRTTDGGASWTLFNTISLSRLYADPTIAGTFYAGHDKSCYKSTDGGASWPGGYNAVLGSCSSLELQGGQLYFGSNIGVFSSPVTAWSWQACCSGIYTREIVKVTVSTTMPNLLFAVDKNGDFFRSTDFGDSWVLTTDVFQGHILSSLFMSPSYIPCVYASSLTAVRCGSG